MKVVVINVFQKLVIEDGCEKTTRRTAVHVTRYQKFNVNCVLFYVFVVLFLKHSTKTV